MAVPTATYRVQLHAGFTFDDAAAAVPYLAALGVSHLYCSPYLQAAPGSTHGYDVVDHRRANDELGGEAGRLRLVAACRAAGIAQLLDIVPNHMAVEPPEANAWWSDVLTHGSASPWAGYFDIDFSRGRLLLPVLGDPGDLDRLRLDGDRLALDDRSWPTAPGTVDSPDDDPARVHARQSYELAHWRRGNDELGYRRFFDITSLAGIRVEDARVFDDTHDTVLGWLRAGEVDGLRIDHPDGLADPQAYLERLAAASDGAYVVVEKILEPGEELPRWPVAGTTGYDALRLVTEVFADPDGLAELGRAAAARGGDSAQEFPELVHRLKLTAATTALSAERRRLGRLAVAAGLEPGPDLDAALAELLACFPVYRSYVRVAREPDPASLAVIAEAESEAIRYRPDLAEVLARLAGMLRAPDPQAAGGAAAAFAVRFQQTSGMVMAKGVEDTAFYRWQRLVALNEVGGDPAGAGLAVADWHRAATTRAQDWPAAMTALSTHDTKRSEDVRARLLTLSWHPQQWAATLATLEAVADRLDPTATVDPGTRLMLWQALVGAWPLPEQRALAYAEKATREAKDRTSWTDPDPAFDAALADLVRGVLADPQATAALDGAIDPAEAARVSLGQKLLALTMPGVPDVYQGSEWEDLSLVDPDNRRPVDYAARAARLAELDAGEAPDDLSGRKQLLTAAVLRLRRDQPATFAGDYAPWELPLPLLGFVRGAPGARVAVAVAVRPGGLPEQVRLPEGTWRPVLTGGDPVSSSAAASAVFATWPVTVLQEVRA